MLIEREEGLFTRHGATRALCIVATATWALMSVAVLVLLASVLDFENGTSVIDDGWIFEIIVPLMVALSVVVGALWWWRRCDRCQKRLFADARSQLNFRMPGAQSTAPAWLQADAERDYRAKTFLGSYRSAAILGMTFKGKLHCQWCGHEDGAKPDYVVTSGP